METDAVRIKLATGDHSFLSWSNFMFYAVVFHEYLGFNPYHGSFSIIWTVSNLLSVKK